MAGGGGGALIPGVVISVVSCALTSVPTATFSLARELRCWQALILGCGLIAYATSFFGVYLFDDWSSIVNITAYDSWGAGFERAWSSPRWVTDFSFFANIQLLGRGVWGFHAVNLAIHLAAGMTWFAVMREWLSSSAPAAGELLGRRFAVSPRAILRLSAFAALLWTVHPLQTQAVTYLAQRYESLSGLFAFLMLAAYGRARDESTGWRWAALAGLCAILSISSKQSGVIAPLLATLYERSVFRQTWTSRVSARGLFYVLGLPAMAFAILPALPHQTARATSAPVVAESRSEASGSTDGSTARSVAVANAPSAGDDFAGFDYQRITPFEYLRSQGNVLIHYARLVFWPYPQCFDYAWPVSESLADALPGCLIVGCVLLVAMVSWLRGSAWGYLLLSTFVGLSVTSTILPIRDLAVEHRMYLPSAFLITFAVSGGWRLLTACVSEPRRGRATVALATIVALTCIILTLRRNLDYRSEVALWQSTADVATKSSRAYYNLGHAWLRAGSPARALLELTHALTLDELPANKRFITPSELAQHHNRRGTALHELQRLEEAELEYRQAIALNPRLGLAHHNLANCYAIQNRVEEAHEEFRLGVQYLPGDAKVRFDWANLYAQHGRSEQAIALYSEALRLNPRHVDALINRGTAQLELERVEAGVRDLEKALTLITDDDPRAVNTRDLLAKIRLILQQPAE